MILRNGYKVMSLLATLGLLACNGQDGAGAPGAGNILGTDAVTGSPQPIPSATPPADPADPTTPTVPSGPAPRVGASCSGKGGDHVCLALKYVVYSNSQADAILSEAEAVSNLEQINSLWAQCDLSFEFGEYLVVDPTRYGLEFNTTTFAGLGDVRQQFRDSSTLLVVSTGQWAGSLGSGAANAWTTMPGGSPLGVVLEESVSKYPNIIAHELGHYLNLPHVSDASDVMNPTIYSTSTKLTASQCSAARSAANYYWKKMYR